MAHRALMAHRAGLLLALLSALAAAAGSSSSPAGSQPAAAAAADCRGLLQQFYSFNAKEAAPLAPENLVYFLHIPRTAGRTFHSCLLRLGTPGRRRCPKAYDHLRIDFALPQCHLLSSHDDFSVVEQLPANTAVVTQLRDPVDRLLSAYEFAIEVAARQLRRSKNYVKPKGRVVTDDVWPWSYLVPFFVDDIKPKVRGDVMGAARRSRGDAICPAVGDCVGDCVREARTCRRMQQLQPRPRLPRSRSIASRRGAAATWQPATVHGGHHGTRAMTRAAMPPRAAVTAGCSRQGGAVDAAWCVAAGSSWRPALQLRLAVAQPAAAACAPSLSFSFPPTRSLSLFPSLTHSRPVPPRPPGVWSEQRSDEGKLYYFNKLLNISKWSLSEDEQALLAPNLDPYNNRLFMPLSEFAASPIAAELLHNGQLMQVLGLTNYSHWQGAAGLRACMSRDAAVADELLAFALRRIERFTHVGATDKLVHSVEAAAASLSMALDGPAYGAGEVRRAAAAACNTASAGACMRACMHALAAHGSCGGDIVHTSHLHSARAHRPSLTTLASTACHTHAGGGRQRGGDAHADVAGGHGRRRRAAADCHGRQLRQRGAGAARRAPAGGRRAAQARRGVKAASGLE